MKFKIHLHSIALHAQIYLITNSFGLEGHRRKEGRGFADFVEKFRQSAQHSRSLYKSSRSSRIYPIRN
jgi:hypothetical protein